MRIYLITGTRKLPPYIAEDGISKLLDLQTRHLPREEIVLIHGGATGVDTLAKRWAVDNKHHAFECMALWDQLGRRDAGPIRNCIMVEISKSLMRDHKVECLAFPIQKSKGTFHCIRRAQEAGIETTITLLD